MTLYHQGRAPGTYWIGGRVVWMGWWWE